MRRARLTFIGAFHHVMNRGHNRQPIFQSQIDKLFFLQILHSRALLNKIKIFAYCIMDNHYHLILQNSSGKLSDFMKQLNSIYATYYRKKYGGEGYVFQNRFKSTLIQAEKYLLNSILYTIQNPMRANITDKVFDYQFSSIKEYLDSSQDNITDKEFVINLFGSRENIIKLSQRIVEIGVKDIRLGKVMGDDKFIEEAIKKFDRRKEIRYESCRQRKDDIGFKPYNRVIEEFENENKMNINDIDTQQLSGKRLRVILLIKLREESGLRYSQINKIRIFQSLKLGTLSVIYSRAKNSYRYKIWRGG